MCFTGFLGYGGHPRGQRVGVDPSLSYLLPLAHSCIQTAPAVRYCHYRQAVDRHVLGIYNKKSVIILEMTAMVRSSQELRGEDMLLHVKRQLLTGSNRKSHLTNQAQVYLEEPAGWQPDTSCPTAGWRRT